MQKSVPSDRRLAGRGALSASLHKVVERGDQQTNKNAHPSQKWIPSDSFYKTSDLYITHIHDINPLYMPQWPTPTDI